MDPLTVIAHERPGGKSMHVEIPLSVSGDSAVVYSKDNQGLERLHTVSTGGVVDFLDFFGPVQQRYNFRPFYDDGQTTAKFYKLDPSRIVSITIDSSACPCEFGFGGVIPVAITEPSEATTSERIITVAGTVGEPVTSANLRVNNSLQSLVLNGNAFSTQAVLRAGENRLRVAVDAPDDRRGCAERTIRSETQRTTISATLTWNLADVDVDLYVTQPDGETAWYSNRDTAIGGRLDVEHERLRARELLPERRGGGPDPPRDLHDSGPLLFGSPADRRRAGTGGRLARDGCRQRGHAGGEARLP